MAGTNQFIDSNKQKVIQIADYGAPYVGNFLALLQRLRNNLEDIGLKQILILPHRANKKAWFKEFVANNMPIYLLDTNLSLPNISKQIADIFMKEKPAIVHTHFTRFDVPSYLACDIATLKGLKQRPRIVWHVHSNFFVKNTLIRKIKDKLKWSYMGKNVYVICDSEELEENIKRKNFSGKSSVVINGIDIIRAQKTNKSNYFLRKSLGIPENNLLILSFGWSPYIKGVDLLVNASQKLNRNDISILIIGRDQLRKYVTEEFGTLPDNVVLAEPDEYVGNLYNVADLFISASRQEGCPYSVMEAMANGLPVIASNIRALRWAQGLKGVIFFESCNVNDLTQKILEVSSMDLKKREKISKENSEFIRINYSMDTWVNNIINIYHKLLGDG